MYVTLYSSPKHTLWPEYEAARFESIDFKAVLSLELKSIVRKI